MPTPIWLGDLRARHWQPAHGQAAPARQQARRPRIEIGFAHAGYDPARPIAATVHGQILLHPRWGLQLDVSTIDGHRVNNDVVVDAAPAAVDHRLHWPSHIDTLGLVDPSTATTPAPTSWP